jgi:outer membrane protein assembly factor BamB
VLLIAVVTLTRTVRTRYAAWKQQRYDEVRAQVSVAGGEVLEMETGLDAVTSDKAIEVDLYGGPESGYTFDLARAVQLRPYLSRLQPFTLRLAERECATGALTGLANLSNVQALTASTLSDADMFAIAKLPGLQALGLAGHHITDLRLRLLSRLPQLRCLALAGTHVTQQGAEQLEAASSKLAVFLAFSGQSDFPDDHPPFAIEAEGPDSDEVIFHRDAAGRRLWSFQTKGVNDNGQLVWDDKRVFCPYKDGVTALDAATGRIAWESKGVSEELKRVGDDLLIAITAEHVSEQGGRQPAHMLGRNVTDGKIVFSCDLPLFGEGDHGTVSAAGEAVMYHSSSIKGAGGTVLIDRTGRQLLQVNEIVFAAVPQDADWILLKPDGFHHVRSDGSEVWATLTINGQKTTGQMLRCPNGDLIGLTYGAQDDRYEVLRVAGSTGSVKWRDHWQAPTGTYFSYWLTVRLELRRGLLGISQDGTDGLQVRVLDAATGKPVLLLNNVPRAREDDLP